MSEIAKTPSKVWQRATANARLWAVLVSLCFCFSVLLTPVLAHQGELEGASEFIEGFPDVPLLSSVTGLLADPVVFDTASGTVAEAKMTLALPFERVVREYDAALTSLGWQCDTYGSGLRCLRENSKLTLLPGPGVQGASTMSLRLEPS